MIKAVMAGGGMQQGAVEIGELTLEHGDTLAAATIGYCSVGQLSNAADNCVLVLHGYANGPEMIDPKSDYIDGSWGALIGRGRAIDTDRFFVLSLNTLGSSYGSTNAASLNPATAKPYGASFPRLTPTDIIRSQRLALDALNVPRVHALIGVSFGGMLAFQWGIQYPDAMARLVAVTCAPKAPLLPVEALTEQLSRSPAWCGGDYHGRAKLTETLKAIRIATLRAHGIGAILAERFPEAGQGRSELERIATQWAEQFDADSLLILARALADYDATPHLMRLKAPVLYALSSTDELFPPALAPMVMAEFERAGVLAEYFEICSPYQHFASGVPQVRWVERLRSFLES